MTKTFQMTRLGRVGNWFLSNLIRVGLMPGSTVLLATEGRKTGKKHVLPVTLVEQNNARWLVAPYGDVDWVRNVRANPRIQLRKGRRVEFLEAVELDADTAAPVLKSYLEDVPIVRPYFEIGPDALVDDFKNIASNHPVFEIVEPATAQSSTA